MKRESSNDVLRSNIKYYRITQGMTQDKLSAMLGINEKHYSRLENGVNKYTLDTLDKVAEVLNKEPWELLKEKHSFDEVPNRLDFYKKSLK